MTARASDAGAITAPTSVTVDTAVRRIELVCLGFAALGALLPIAYATPMFAVYRGGVAALAGDAALASGSPTSRLFLGMAGGAIAGKWLAHYAIARFGLRRRLRWARNATLAGLVTWWLLDSTVSVWSGAWMNLALINPLPPLLILPLLVRIWRRCDRDLGRPRDGWAGRAARVAAGLGIASGLAIALGGDSALFAPWREALGIAQFGGAEPPAAARAIGRWFYGPIGGATAGHFVLLAFLIAHRRSIGEPVAWRWYALSLLGWFVVDSGWSLASGAAFNVWMVNLPVLSLALLPFLGAGLYPRRRS